MSLLIWVQKHLTIDLSRTPRGHARRAQEQAKSTVNTKAVGKSYKTMKAQTTAALQAGR